jgi:hypothetical protein
VEVTGKFTITFGGGICLNYMEIFGYEEALPKKEYIRLVGRLQEVFYRQIYLVRVVMDEVTRRKYPL